MMEKVITLAGKKMHYRVWGKGRPVVLQHGFGENSDIWDQQVAVLEDSCLLIIPELPGSGRSEIVEDMSMVGLAEILKAVIDSEIGASRAITLIGHSMGGYITLAFAEKYPDRLNAFGLFHSTAYADSEEKKEARARGIAFIKEHGAFAFLKTSTPTLFSAKTRDERPDLVDKQIAGLSNFSPEALVLYYRAMMQRPDRTHALKKSKVPVLFIMGKQDLAAPLEDVLQQCHLPEKAYIHVLQESAHLGMLEETMKSNLILKNFISEISENPD